MSNNDDKVKKGKTKKDKIPPAAVAGPAEAETPSEVQAVDAAPVKPSKKAGSPVKKKEEISKTLELPAAPIAPKKAAAARKKSVKEPEKTAESSSSEKAVVEEKKPATKRKTKATAATVDIAAENVVASEEKLAPLKKAATKKATAPAKKKDAVTKAETKKAATLNTIIYTVEVRFYTRPGEDLFITGNHAALGNSDFEHALKMDYLSHDVWTATFKLDKSEIPANGITYNFMVKYPNGVTALDWGNDKTLTLTEGRAPRVHVKDSWNHPGYYENAFFTEPFTQVLLKRKGEPLKELASGISTHLFKVKAPLLLPHQSICILGNDVAFGEWDEAKPTILTKEENGPHFIGAFDLGEAAFPLAYKYAVCETSTGRIISYEEGENRVLHGDANDENFTIVNDGFAVLKNSTWKGAGTAVPVFSLRSEKSFGVGSFSDIKLLADWAAATGQQLIQVLPVNDSTASYSWMDSYPYAAISAFALHPMYLDLAAVINKGQENLLSEIEQTRLALNARDTVDYEGVNRLKWDFIKKVYPLNSAKIFASKGYKDFYLQNEHWLKPYAAFCHLRDKFHTAHFNRWPVFNQYNAEEIEQMIAEDKEVADSVSMYYFVQYHLHLQLKEAADYVHSKGIILKGDIPIGVYRYSADVWQQPELYNLHLQAGAPPDDFAVNGQNWGFPTYNWDKMKQDDFDWWKRRFKQMSYYFDAFRVDHILGFFRIWSVPYSSLDGIMGHFEPAVPVNINEFHARSIPFDYDRLTKPYITEEILHDIFGDQQHYIRNTFLINHGYGHYSMKPEFDSQRKVHNYFKHFENNAHNRWLQASLNGLLANVILFEAENSEGTQFHFRFNMFDTTSFKQLDEHSRYQLNELYVDYFFRRQDEVWKQEALERLPRLKRSTDMLICGEDLGLVPACVPDVMKQLGLLNLEIQRMPKESGLEFFNPVDAPYLSVVMPSTHDMSTIRGWWEEDRNKSQRFYNQAMGYEGYAPYLCDAWVNTAIVKEHLYSPAMWSIFQLQDILGMNAAIRRDDPTEERINIPSVSRHYWKYRMHLTLEKLIANTAFNNELKGYVVDSGRGKRN